MKNSFFDTIVKKLLKTKHKVFVLEKIKKIIHNIMLDEYTDQKMYKIVYYLRSRGYLECLKKNVYFVKRPDDYFSQERYLDHFYRKLLKEHCKQFLHSDWYIGGLKALELHMYAYDIPDEILVVNGYKQATEVVMFEKKMLCKTYISKGKNIFTQCKKYIDKYALNRAGTIPVACLELAILESLYNPAAVHKAYTDEMIKKTLKKHSSTLQIRVRQELLQLNKHHISMNRLYTLAQVVDPRLAERVRELIKKYSYFITSV